MLLFSIHNKGTHTITVTIITISIKHDISVIRLFPMSSNPSWSTTWNVSQYCDGLYEHDNLSLKMVSPFSACLPAFLHAWIPDVLERNVFFLAWHSIMCLFIYVVLLLWGKKTTNKCSNIIFKYYWNISKIVLHANISKLERQIC